jgi:hypothetical protein
LSGIIKDIPGVFIQKFYGQTVVGSFLNRMFERPVILTAERSGTVMFKEVMNLGTNKLFQLISKKEAAREKVRLSDIFETLQESGYPDAVHSNVEMVNRFESLGKKNSPLLEKHKHLKSDLESVVGGTFETTDGITYFIPSDTQDRISIKNSSSATRSLVHLWYWLIGEASPGQILMIDEPELNLHPATQRRLARFLAKLVNLGVYVFATTHSDILVHELNNLILLGANEKKRKNIEKDYPEYKNAEGIRPEDVGMHITRHTSDGVLLDCIDINQEGFDKTAFDSHLSELVDIQTTLLYGETDD